MEDAQIYDCSFSIVRVSFTLACCFGEEPPYEAICCNKISFTGRY